VGGKVDAGALGTAVLEETARREVAEEIGVDLTGVDLTGIEFRYVSSVSFTTDDGDPIINVVFAAPLPVDAQPTAAAPDEVADILWLTETEAAADPNCPPWTLTALSRVAGST
jgi:8-oxo-dGTP diphosphatase